MQTTLIKEEYKIVNKTANTAKTTKLFRVKFDSDDITNMSIFITIALIQKYPSIEQWENENAFEMAMDVLSITMGGFHNQSEKDELEEFPEEYIQEEQCSFRLNHGYSHCTCGNHAGFKEVIG